MNTWAPIWSQIVDSSLWEESGDVVKVFMTMLATKDSDHVCRLDAYRIAKKCCLDELVVLDILKLLASPDTRRKVSQPFGGRRIKAVEDGWLLLNGDKYRSMVQEEMRKARWRRAQTTARHKKKTGQAPPSDGGEMAYERNVERFGQVEADRIQDVKNAIGK